MKKPHLWIIVLTSWIICAVAILYPAVDFLFRSASVLQQISLIIFLIWVNFVWIYSIYQLALIFTTSTLRREKIRIVSLPQEASVAVLYTTMNDFSNKAALSCVKQDYSKFHVFLLDDSIDRQYQEQVDSFQDRHTQTTTIIRRQDRIGFKAGNLNHAIQLINSDYKFFVICDADGILPPDFIRKTLSYFTDESIGFVQARQRVNTLDSVTSFVADLSAEVEIYWEQIVPPAQKFGFVMFHGHGGIIRMKVWKEIGGFPTMVAEDLAFSTRAREKGYIGVIAHDVVCEEEFPSSYYTFAKRRLKYARGTFEHLRFGMWSFLCSSEAKWFEKIDRILASLAMVSALPLFVFLLNLVFLIPLAFSKPLPVNQIHGGYSDFTLIWPIPQFDISSLSIFTLPFYIMMVISLLVPLIPAACHLWKYPRKFMRYAIASVAVHLSLIIDQALDILAIAITGKNFFPVTGDQAPKNRNKAIIGSGNITVLNVISIFIISILLVTAIVSKNIVLLPIFLAIGFGLIAKMLYWEHRLVRITYSLPIVGIILMIVLGYGMIVGLCGLSILVAAPGF